MQSWAPWGAAQVVGQNLYRAPPEFSSVRDPLISLMWQESLAAFTNLWSVM
jgi:hypothetical protein